MDARTKYDEAVKEFKAKAAEAERIASFFASIGHKFVTWKNIRLSNTRAQRGFSISSAIKNPLDIDMSKWPSQDEVEKAIYDYDEAKSKLVNAYGAIPNSAKESTVKPETFF